MKKKKIHDIIYYMFHEEKYLQLPMWGTEHENRSWHRGTTPIDQRASVCN